MFGKSEAVKPEQGGENPAVVKGCIVNIIFVDAFEVRPRNIQAGHDGGWFEEHKYERENIIVSGGYIYIKG